MSTYSFGFRSLLGSSVFDPLLEVSFTAYSSSFRLSFRFGFKTTPLQGGPRSAFMSCNSSYRGGFFGAPSGNGDDHDYLEASFLVPGEFAIQKLIDTSQENANGECPTNLSSLQMYQKYLDVMDLFPSFQVKVVRMVERLVNTYFARIYFGKAPIYVSKQIVFTDAVRLVYGIGRVPDRKPTYDVSLDSYVRAIDGPDPLAEELGLLMNMNLAAKEERYKDAAMLRNKLMKLSYNT